MLLLDKKNISSNISKFHMFIAETDNFDISGTLCNFDYNFSIAFASVRQMMERLEILFDCVNFPQATHQTRTFHDDAVQTDVLQMEWIRTIDPRETNDKEAEFLLHVQFRHHSTWQGTLELCAQRVTKPFRSQLELLTLLVTAPEK